MTVLIKLFYAGGIATLLILLVAFGIRTFYVPPDEPRFPQPVTIPRLAPVIVTPTVGDPALVVPTPTPEQQDYEEEQRNYQDRYEAYTKDRAEYRRTVFLIASIIGVAVLAGGLMLPARLDAIRLGLVAGGLGTVLYGVFQAGGDLDEAGPTVIFLAASLGLLLVMAAGYRWLSRLEST